MAIQHDEYQKRMSLEQFFAFVESDPDHRYELIDSYPYMMTGGSPDHSIICNNLGRILGNLLRKQPCIVYNSDVYVQLSQENSCVCPDVSVSCYRRDRRATKAIQYPSLVVEVLSSSTKIRDRGLKAELYQNIATVQEILLVDTQVMRMQLYRRETDYWTMRNFTHDHTIELTSLNVQFSLVEAYEKTTFDENFLEEELKIWQRKYSNHAETFGPRNFFFLYRNTPRHI
ncbi:MAG TPA: Uma2 family endonuclease [Ktedonobacteraceae bacterium]